MKKEESRKDMLDNGNKYVSYKEFVSWAGKLEAVQQSLTDISHRLNNIEEDLRVVKNVVTSTARMEVEVGSLAERLEILASSAEAIEKRVGQVENTVGVLSTRQIVTESFWEKVLKYGVLPLVSWVLGVISHILITTYTPR